MDNNLKIIYGAWIFVVASLFIIIQVIPFVSSALTDDLVAYWKHEEASGHLIDAHGSHDSVTELNVGYQATGIIDYGIYFPGTGYYAMAVSEDFAFTSGFSVQFWVDPNNTLGNFAPLGMGSWVSTGFMFTQSTGAGKLYFSVQDDYCTSNAALSNVEYQHIVGVRENNGTIKMYINAVLQDDTGNNTDTIVATSALTVGAWSDLTRKFPGLVDEVAIWGKPLTQAEVTELYNEGNGLAYPFGPVDSCTCAGLDTNWEVNMSDNCELNSACELGTGMLNFTGAGYANCSANINTTNLGDPGTSGILYISSDCLINVKG